MKFGTGLERGIYVDVSKRYGGVVLGFVQFTDEYHIRWSTSASCRNTQQAEEEAIRIALQIYPGERVFCDCIEAVRREGGEYINRALNGPAHRTARMRKNFFNRNLIDRIRKSNLGKTFFSNLTTANYVSKPVEID